MAKKLIIKTADFSVNGITNINGVSVVNAFSYSAKDFTKASTTTQNSYFPAPSYQTPLVKNKTVYGVRVRTVSTGNFQVLKMTGYSINPTVGSHNSATVEVIGTYQGVGGKITTVIFDEPIVVPNTGNVCFGVRPNSTAMYFRDTKSPYLYYTAPGASTWKYTNNYGGGFELLVELDD